VNINKLFTKLLELLLSKRSHKGLRSSHFFIILALMAIGTFTYYVDQTALADGAFFSNSFFTGVHDLQRILFFIPILYASVVFRLPGSLATSSVFLLIVLPRALLFSPYPEPILRPLLFVLLALVLSSFLAAQLNNIEQQRRLHKELLDLYQKVVETHNRLKQSQQQLIQAEKLTSLGQLAASIAHEINNPLGSILVYTQFLLRQLNEEQFTRSSLIDQLKKIESETSYSSRLVKNLLDFARQSPPSLSPVNINHVVEGACSLVSHSAELNNVTVIKRLDKSLPQTKADYNQLKQVFTNLILNAVQAMPSGGQLEITTYKLKKSIILKVKDSGLGIKKEHIDKLFTPFFTTKEKVMGVGLGLSVAYGIVQRHGGLIKVKTKEGKGTTFTVCLPVKK